MRNRALRKKHTPVDKSVLMVGVGSRWEDRSYLDSMREGQCTVTMRCGTEHETIDPAHLRIGFYGAGAKPHDFHCLPLLHSEHLKQSPEGEYWTAVANENPHLLYEFIKSYATLRYIKHKLGVETDRHLVARVMEMMDG